MLATRMLPSFVLLLPRNVYISDVDVQDMPANPLMSFIRRWLHSQALPPLEGRTPSRTLLSMKVPTCVGQSNGDFKNRT